MSMRIVFLSAAALALGVTAASPQSLGEVAAKEKARQEAERKKAGGAAKVITEEDLRGRGAGTYSQPGATGGATTATPGASPSPGASPGAPKQKTEEELRADQEKDWHDRLQKAQEDVTRLGAQADRLQADLNDLTGTLYGASRTNLLNRMEQTKKDLAAANQRVEDLQDEGRRSRYR